MTNHRMVLPGGAVAVRVDDGLGRRYHIHGTPALLTVADVEVLFADSIASDGGAGRELLCGARHCCQCNLTCALEVGHRRPHERDGQRWTGDPK